MFMILLAAYKVVLSKRAGHQDISVGVPVAGRGRTELLVISGAGAWLAVMAGATATSVELALSGTVPLATVLPAMLGVHALIAIGEAVVTVAAVSAVLATRPDLLPGVARETVKPALAGAR